MTKEEKTLKIFKYIGVIVYSLITAFLVFMLCMSIPDFMKQEDLWKLGGAIVMIVTLLASIGYIIPIVLGIIGAVTSHKIQNGKSKRNCIIMIVTPLLTALVNFLTYIVILTFN